MHDITLAEEEDEIIEKIEECEAYLLETNILALTPEEATKIGEAVDEILLANAQK